MLKISDYSLQINELHAQGKSAIEIARELHFKYPQPIYNYFKNKGWERLSREEYPKGNKYEVDYSFFQKIDTEEKAYILGFFCADGHLSLKAYRIRIALQESDVDILEKIKNAMHSTHPIIRNITKSNPYQFSDNKILKQCSLDINGKELVTPLIKMGITSDKTYTLDASICNYIPENLMRHFLRGYFDGDGNVTWGTHYSSGYKYIVQVAGNKDFLLNSYQKYYPSACGLYKYKTAKQCYVWKIANKNEVLKFLHWIYSDATIYLNRKYNIYKYAMWSYKTELIAGNSFFFKLLEGQSAANPLVKSWWQVQRLMDETIKNPFEEEREYNSNTNAQH